jgi:hypothetical protein
LRFLGVAVAGRQLLNNLGQHPARFGILNAIICMEELLRLLRPGGALAAILDRCAASKPRGTPFLFFKEVEDRYVQSQADGDQLAGTDAGPPALEVLHALHGDVQLRGEGCEAHAKLRPALRDLAADLGIDRMRDMAGFCPTPAMRHGRSRALFVIDVSSILGGNRSLYARLTVKNSDTMDPRLSRPEGVPNPFSQPLDLKIHNRT